MCIPCVMCGACMEAASSEVSEGRCPECGSEVPPGAVSCPVCYTFLSVSPRAETRCPPSARLEPEGSVAASDKL